MKWNKIFTDPKPAGEEERTETDSTGGATE